MSTSAAMNSTSAALSSSSSEAAAATTNGALGLATLSATSPSTLGATSPLTLGAMSPSTLGPFSPFSVVPPAPTAAASHTIPMGSLFSGLPSAGASSSSGASSTVHFAHLLPVKLGADNFLFWRSQLLPLLRSYDLEGYIDGSFRCPPATVSHQMADGRVVIVPNSGHRAWILQDQAILHAIVGSLTPAVGSLVILATTSLDAWTTLVHAFDAQTHARATQLRGQLTKMEKGAMSASAFFNQVKAVADTLTSIGQPLRDEEFAAYVIDGLDSDYDNLAENIAGRETPITPRDLYTRVLHTEQRLSARRGSHAFHDPSANAAFRGGRGGGGGGGGGRGGGGGGGPQQQPPRQPNPNPNPPPNFNNGGGNGGGTSLSPGVSAL